MEEKGKTKLDKDNVDVINVLENLNGVFDVKEREARIARNPKNGSAVAVPAKNVPYFRMGKRMKDRLNK